MTNQHVKTAKQPGLFVELLFNIVIPSLILMKLSGDSTLGPVNGLIVALLFPLGYGLWDLYQRRKVNMFSLLGLVSVLLTGGIGLLELDPKYIAIKEAAIPAIIGLVVWCSQYTRFPLVQTLLLNPKIIDVKKLEKKLADVAQTSAFKNTLRHAGIGAAGSFFLSATLNYILARMIVVSPAGTEAFNQEIGRMTALSFPVIVLPTMIILLASIFYLFWQINRLTGESIESFIRDERE
ncbi:MAG TPA: VC0807 family protein [Aliidiomarina sp.]|nr:VC0807 family protein [Aliidiomarina sp.]